MRGIPLPQLLILFAVAMVFVGVTRLRPR